MIELDRALVEVAKSVQILSALSWPEGAIERFLEGWRGGDARLPEVELPRVERPAESEALDAIVAKCDTQDPLQVFVASTAQSYLLAVRMLASIGTPRFTQCSARLYGGPLELLPASGVTHVRAAQMLLTNTDNLAAAGVVADDELCLTADTVAGELRRAFGAFFGEDAPEVILDAELASKAAAGAKRVRLRTRTAFSELDVAQLIEHEGFVHTATALNGRRQPILTSLGLGSPRSTLTQEGLATIAELTTRAIDIARLRRLALRILAIQLALEGADFLEVFRFFLENGQSEDESARSAMRVFRGGDVRGKVVFTKDVVYLQGLTLVHTFLRKAIAESRPHLVRRLFTGRLALGDVLRLDEAFASGDVLEPRFVPAWARDLHRLAAYLAFNVVIGKIDLDAVRLERLVE